jgi:hypothetical protein
MSQYRKEYINEAIKSNFIYFQVLAQLMSQYNSYTVKQLVNQFRNDTDPHGTNVCFNCDLCLSVNMSDEKVWFKTKNHRAIPITIKDRCVYFCNHCYEITPCGCVPHLSYFKVTPINYQIAKDNLMRRDKYIRDGYAITNTTIKESISYNWVLDSSLRYARCATSYLTLQMINKYKLHKQFTNALSVMVLVAEQNNVFD